MERIELSNAAFEGDNNAYLFADGAEVVLVDTGDWLEGTHSQLETELAARGIDFPDIDRIFLTHWHGDHTGLAGKIQAESDATVYIHEDDAPLISGDESAWDEMYETQTEYFDHWGIPEEGQSEYIRAHKKDVLSGESPRRNADRRRRDVFCERSEDRSGSRTGTRSRTVHVRNQDRRPP